MSFPIQPEGDKIIITPIPKNEEIVGSIVIPGTANADISYGKVAAISNEISHKGAPGDIVIYATQAGVSHLINGKDHLWITIQNVWGWYTEDEWNKLNSQNEQPV